MSPETIALVMTAIIGSGALTALVTGYMTRNKTASEAAQIGAATLTALDPLVASWLTRMQTEIADLHREVAQLKLINQQLVKLLQEHDIPTPPLPPV